MSYILCDVTGFLADGPSTQGLEDFAAWAASEPTGEAARFLEVGHSASLAALRLALGAPAEGSVDATRAALLEAAGRAEELLILSDGMGVEELTTAGSKDQPRDDHGRWVDINPGMRPDERTDPNHTIIRDANSIARVIAGRGGASIDIALGGGYETFTRITVSGFDTNGNKDRLVELIVKRPTNEDDKSLPPTAVLSLVYFKHAVTPREARESLRASLNLLRNTGAKNVEVEAALEDGGYLWARLGFKANDPGAFSYEVRHHATNDKELSPKQTAAVYTELKTKDDSLPRRVADLRVDGVRVGRRVLKNLQWSGHATFGDPEFEHRVEHFLGRAA